MVGGVEKRLIAGEVKNSRKKGELLQMKGRAVVRVGARLALLCTNRNINRLSASHKYLHTTFGVVGHTVAQLVGALCYKPEGRGFDSRWCLWNCSLTQSIWPHKDHGG